MTRNNGVCGGIVSVFNYPVDIFLIGFLVLQPALYGSVKDILSTALIVGFVRETVLVQILSETSAESLFQRLHNNGALVLGHNGKALGFGIFYMLFGVTVSVKDTVKGEKTAALRKAFLDLCKLLFVHLLVSFSVSKEPLNKQQFIKDFNFFIIPLFSCFGKFYSVRP